MRHPPPRPSLAFSRCIGLPEQRLLAAVVRRLRRDRKRPLSPVGRGSREFLRFGVRRYAGLSSRD